MCTVTDSPIVSLRRGKVEKKTGTSANMPRTPNGNPPQEPPRRVAKKSTAQPQFMPNRHTTPLDVPTVRAGQHAASVASSQVQQTPAGRTTRSQATERPPTPADQAQTRVPPRRGTRIRDPQHQRSPQRRRRRYRYVLLNNY